MAMTAEITRETADAAVPTILPPPAGEAARHPQRRNPAPPTAPPSAGPHTREGDQNALCIETDQA